MFVQCGHVANSIATMRIRAQRASSPVPGSTTWRNSVHRMTPEPRAAAGGTPDRAARRRFQAVAAEAGMVVCGRGRHGVDATTNKMARTMLANSACG
jgi:hypothetical protein